MKQGNITQAENIAQYCSEAISIPGSGDRRRPRAKSAIEIAMVLPFSGELRSYGEDIYNGAVIAAEEFRARTGRPVRLA